MHFMTDWGEKMALIITEKSPRFDLTEIHIRDFIRAQYHTWNEPRNGIVVQVDKDTLQAIFLPLVHLATRYYAVKAQEVADGKWHILWSQDLQTINEVGEAIGNG